MAVEWLRLALADLDGIYRYIAQANRKIAIRVVGNLWSEGENLGAHPHLGRPGRIEGTRELVTAEPNYIIPYRVKQNRVEILRVLHGKRLWPQDLR